MRQKYSLHYRQDAIQDLSEIWIYTLEEWSEQQADLYFNELDSECIKISRDEVRGRNFDNIDASVLGHRSGSHIIFFTIKNTTVEIVRILHQQMDFKAKFK